ASVNAPGLCVVSGPDADLAALARTLAAEGVETQRIAIDIAAHSRLLDPILAAFDAHLRGMRLSPPRIPVISNRTGQPLTPEQATDPAWWVAHLRGTVDFAACMATLNGEPNRIFLEMGPGRALTSLAQANGIPAARLIPALRHPDQAVADDAWHMATIARLWACGAQADWAQIWGDAPRRRLPLPTYPFQRQRYFVEAQPAARQAPVPARQNDIARWGWQVHWRPAAAAFDGEDLTAAPPNTWLIFLDDEGLGAACAARLTAAGHRVTTVTMGDRFARRDGGYTLSPEQGRDGYDALIRDLVATGRTPDRIAHFWLVTGAERFRPGSSFFHRNLESGFWSITFLAQAMVEENLPPAHLTLITTGAAQVRREPLRYPEKATIAGPARVLPREIPGLTCATLDVDLPAQAAPQVLEELLSPPANTRVALRGPRRYEAGLRPLPLPDATGFTLPPNATVLMTGGLGGIALTLAEDLARRFAARFLIVTRTPLPPRADWPRIAARGGDMADRLRALMGLELLGSEVMVRAADVCNPDDMRAAVAEATARLGPIRAVIHAAGVVDDAPLAGRSSARIEQVLAPKLHGTQVIDRLFPDGSVDWIALFASTSTQIGAAGQVDYVAANEYMNVWSQSRAGGRTRVVAVNWGVWKGAGMAARALARRTPAPPRPLPGPVLTARGTDAAGDALFTGRLTPAD
ncbi:MAG TPA: SDR family NAD(P)-dependent oxidoreductase, partial [Paracoccaceae bacterium]|nr:SDR family NAD(P)-dependent oxidoreductase [Paracoccaceae bacterium]